MKRSPPTRFSPGTEASPGRRRRDEAYEYPYGISPRIGSFRPNEGIPLDHNLTFYEAILLYGPGYDKLIPKPNQQDGLSSVRFNFKARHFDLFYVLFTPLADISLSYKEQCIVGLQWGDGEDFLWNPTPVDKMGMGEGGTLPRATRSLSAAQERLVETALAHKAKNKVLCTHFTLVNYAMDIPLGQEGRIGFADNDFSRYEHGSTKSGRRTLHGDWLARSRFHLTLSGHSHRVGLYRCDPVNEIRMVNVLQPGHVTTKGYHPETPEANNVAWGDRTRVFVTASAGPMPKQNLQGEMSGQGMEPPSAGKIVFTEGAPRITLVKPATTTAKPRFAVACDYIDIMCGGFWEYFRATGNTGEFEMKVHWEKIHPNLSRSAKEKLLKGATLYMLIRNKAEEFECSDRPQLLNDNILQLRFGPSLINTFRFRKNEIKAIFLSLTFNRKAVDGFPGFSHYDFESPWNLQVEIFNTRYEEDLDLLTRTTALNGYSGRHAISHAHNDLLTRKAEHRQEDLAIRRDRKDGEIPSFLFRYENSASEYESELDLPK